MVLPFTFHDYSLKKNITSYTIIDNLNFINTTHIHFFFPVILYCHGILSLPTQRWKKVEMTTLTSIRFW